MRNLHLTLAHHIWRDHLQKPSLVIDATAGNGYDALFLAKILNNQKGSSLYVFDIQKQAIETTQAKIAQELPCCEMPIHYLKASHYPFPSSLVNNTVDLIIYNLGYLPGGNKTITTTASVTLPSLQQALLLLKTGGLLSITCYPGHPEGLVEYEQILQFTGKLNKDHYTIYHLQSNKPTAPQLITIRKDLNSSQGNL